MKKVSFIAVMLLFLLSGCSYNSYVYIGQKEVQTSTSWSMDYQKFTGHDTYEIQVDDFHVPLSLMIDTEEGSFTLTVYQEKQEIYAFSESGELSLSKAGSYTLRIDGDGHKGGFLVQWG